MTEANMKKMYDNFVKLGLKDKAKALVEGKREGATIGRYAHFVKKEEIKSKVKK